MELIQHLELTTIYRSKLNPCGYGFDLKTGDVFRLTAEGPLDDSRDTQCGLGCYYVQAEAVVEGVRIRATREEEHAWPDLVAEGNAELLASCNGRYAISVMQVPRYLQEDPSIAIASDYMLLRTFSTSDPPRCLVESSQIVEGDGTCWDAWAVRIRDSSGHLVTKDFPQPPGFGDGGSEGGLGAADAGS